MNRVPAALAGFHAAMDSSCATLTIGLSGGGSLGNPSSCGVGYSFYDKPMYTCSGERTGAHCDPFGYNTIVKVSSGGHCPSLPISSGFPWSSSGLAETPSALFRSLTCVPPRVAAFSELSAKLSVCPGSEEVLPEHNAGERFQGPGGSGVWGTTATAASLIGIQGVWNLFNDAYDHAQTGAASELTGVIKSVALAHQGLIAASLRGSVRIEHWDAGGQAPAAIYTENISGSISSSGRFDCQRQTPGTSQGDPVVIFQRTTFDGVYLRDLAPDGETGNAYLMNAQSDPRLVEMYAMGVEPLYDWVVDPYSIPLFQGGIDFAETLTTEGHYLLQRHHTLVAGGTFIGTEYEVVVRNGKYLPVRRSEMSPDGKVWTEFTYSNFLEVRPGDWRPGQTVMTRFLDGTTLGSKVVVRTTVNQASALDLEADAGMPVGYQEQRMWQVWQMPQ